VTAAEVGGPARTADDAVVAVVRGGAALSPADPHLGPLAAGDRLVMSAPPGPPRPRSGLAADG
jgi:hypothetical protein